MSYGGKNDLGSLLYIVFDNYRAAVVSLLHEYFPNLYFSVDMWYPLRVRVYLRGVKEGETREWLPIDTMLESRGINEVIFSAYNDKAGIVRADFDNKFICSNCGQIKDKNTEFAENVFASYFCTDCAKKPEIASLISDSHKPNYYD